MNQIFTILLAYFLGLGGLHAQTIFFEDFNSGNLPTGWEVTTDATDGGWLVGTPAALSSQFWNINDPGSGPIIATNDDQCNCNKRNDYLITPSIDLSGIDHAVLRADLYFGAGSFQGSQEEGTIEVSTDGGTSWTVIETLQGEADWYRHAVDLSDYAGQADVRIGFHYNDDGGWLFGWALDNVEVVQPDRLEAEILPLQEVVEAETGNPYPFKATIRNNGYETIESMRLRFQYGSNESFKDVSGLSISPFESAGIEYTDIWTPTESSTSPVVIEIMEVNGEQDANGDNNIADQIAQIYEKVERVNIVDDFLGTEPVMEVIADIGDQLDRPTDLDFHYILAKNELWVINQRVENTGGSTVTFFDPGTPQQDSWQRVDGNAWHFMSLPTALAFGDNGNWASSPGVKDANHSGGTFTGPTLWSSNPDIYAQPSGGNGSHLDMLHGSPFSMGIAHEVDNVYWVFDGWNQTIVRYDFREDHGPGNDFHGDALVRRYLEISVSRDGDVPSHMVMDKSTGWLYVVDNGNDRVLRINTNSGQVMGALPLINEALTEHSEMGNVEWEVIIDQGLDRASGIDIIDNRLLVGDYSTGEIIVYDIDNQFTEIGRIPTGSEGLTGIKIGPDGNLWFTNREDNILGRMEPGMTSATDLHDRSDELHIYPNPNNGNFRIGNLDQQTLNYRITAVDGRELQNGITADSQIQLLQPRGGTYFLHLWTDEYYAVKRIVVE